MLKKLEDTGHEAGMNKSSIKQVRRSVQEGSKLTQEQFQAIVPKKSAMFSIKAKSGEDERRVEVILVEKEVMFVNVEGRIVPSLRLVHKYPSMYPVFRCDKGALKFIINGANVMCPGLTQPTSSMQDVPKGTVVALYVEGKEHALALGVTTLSTQQIRTVNKGIAVEMIHFLGDAFWRFQHKKK